VAALTKADKEVWVIWPPLLPGLSKTDLNDVLQSRAGGAAAVRKLLQECRYQCRLDD
jgi:hypothetical protein